MNGQYTVQVLDATIKESSPTLDFQRVRLASQADGTRQNEEQRLRRISYHAYLGIVARKQNQ